LPTDHAAAIADVLVRYATGIDRRDWKLFSTCFTVDCDADYGEIGHWHGTEEITAWMADSHEPLGLTMHRITNVVVAIADDATATSRSYVHGVVTTADRSAAIHAFGYYDDELVSTSDGWQIARRLFTPVTMEMHTPIG
jgi:3-phenylpropionate/cinnamic acid dioxygenase small subunit